MSGTDTSVCCFSGRGLRQCRRPLSVAADPLPLPICDAFPALRPAVLLTGASSGRTAAAAPRAGGGREARVRHQVPRPELGPGQKGWRWRWRVWVWVWVAVGGTAEAGCEADRALPGDGEAAADDVADGARPRGPARGEQRLRREALCEHPQEPALRGHELPLDRGACMLARWHAEDTPLLASCSSDFRTHNPDLSAAMSGAC
eukprot:2653422-Rhodomonas_salina.2